jgi:hypothetical protein
LLAVYSRFTADLARYEMLSAKTVDIFFSLIIKTEVLGHGDSPKFKLEKNLPIVNG